MATNTKRKYARRIILIFVLIAGLWGFGIWRHMSDVAKANKLCEEAVAANPTPTPTPIGSPKPTPSPTTSPTPAASPTPSNLPAGCRPDGKAIEPPKLFTLGLDLQGGISVVLNPKPGQPTDQGSLQKAVDIIQQRVDALGVAEPDITLQGENVLIQLPGIKDQARALRLIGTTAKLRFRTVLEGVATPASTHRGLKVPLCSDQATWPEDDPKKEIILCAKQSDPTTGKQTPPETWLRYVLGPVELEGTDIATADAVLPPTSGSWEVSLELNGEGAKKFENVTKELCTKSGDQRELAIVLDRLIESHPSVNEESCPAGIGGGRAVITGNFTESESKDLALVLKYGALPVELERSTVTTISPSLGKESLQGGLLAGAIGLAIVFLYVLIFYRALGLIIWFGLAIHSAFTLVVVMLLGQAAGFALSLAGIAGLIVSLGVAADSFIVYFERVKDEVLSGRTVRSAVDRAWTSAWRTIFAADLVTALAAVVLYTLAVGSVRGFALMLGLATFLDLFVSRWFMHPAVWLLAQTKRFNESKTLGIQSVAGVGATPAPLTGGQR